MIWKRVSTKFPCPICKHDSWCMVNGVAVMCMRVASEQTKAFRDGSVAYIHRLTEPLPDLPKVDRKPEPVINCAKLLDAWVRNMPFGLVRLATKLGVSQNALARLNCCFAREHHAWAFPMRDGYGELVGIRLRHESGKKWAVPGSHAGIFLPCGDAQELALICEGPTDTAAALSMGFFAVGRPSCSGGGGHIRTALKRLCVRRAVIVADKDDPGMRGAMMLAEQLPVSNCIVLLPTKDVREFANRGGDRTTFESILSALVWRQPKVNV